MKKYIRPYMELSENELKAYEDICTSTFIEDPMNENEDTGEDIF